MGPRVARVRAQTARAANGARLAECNACGGVQVPALAWLVRKAATGDERQRLLQKSFELPNEIDEWNAQHFAHSPEFEQIQSARSRFVIADESLWLSECTGHVHLSEAGLRPKLAKQGQESLLLPTVRR